MPRAWERVEPGTRPEPFSSLLDATGQSIKFHRQEESPVRLCASRRAKRPTEHLRSFPTAGASFMCHPPALMLCLRYGWARWTQRGKSRFSEGPNRPTSPQRISFSFGMAVSSRSHSTSPRIRLRGKLRRLLRPGVTQFPEEFLL